METNAAGGLARDIRFLAEAIRGGKPLVDMVFPVINAAHTEGFIALGHFVEMVWRFDKQHAGREQSFPRGLADALADYAARMAADRLAPSIMLDGAYREMAAMLGETVSEGAMFLPRLPFYPEAWISPAAMSDSAFREYLHGAIPMLMDAAHELDFSAGATAEVRRLLMAIETKNPFYELRMLLDSSIALADSMVRHPATAPTHIALLALVCEQLRCFNGDANYSFDSRILSSLLYFALQQAKHSDPGARARHLVRNLSLVQWDAPKSDQLAALEQKVLSSMDLVQEAFDRACQKSDFTSFRAVIGQVANTARAGVGGPALHGLATGLLSALDRGTQPEDGVRMNIAQALLVMSDLIGANWEERPELERRAQELAVRLADGATAAEVVMTTAEVTDKSRNEAMQLLYAEITTDIDSASEGRSPQLVARIRGGLLALQLLDAADVTAELNEAADARAAAILDMLRQYVALLAAGSIREAEVLLRDFPAAHPTEAQVEAETEAMVDRPSDPDMKEVFLEEATEILAGIALPLQDIDHAREIRRAFHTFKGSGRMVGLSRLGGLAWDVERVLNHYLSAGILVPDLDPFVQEAVHAIREAVSILNTHDAVLLDGSWYGTEAERLLALDLTPWRGASADTLDLGFGALGESALPVVDLLAPLPSVPEAEAVPVVDIEPLRRPYTVGDAMDDSVCAPDLSPAATAADAVAGAIAPAPDAPEASAAPDTGASGSGAESGSGTDWIIDIFAKDAPALVQALDDGLTGLSSEVTHEFMRAAHTLSSNMAAIGAMPAHHLAQQLERVLRPGVGYPVSEHEAQVIGRAVDLLSRQISNVVGRLPCPLDEDLTAELAALADSRERSSEEAAARLFAESDVPAVSILPEPAPADLAVESSASVPEGDVAAQVVAPEVGAGSDAGSNAGAENLAPDPLDDELGGELSFDLPGEGALSTESPATPVTDFSLYLSSGLGGEAEAGGKPEPVAIPADLEDEIDPAMLPVFMEESGELMAMVPGWLQNWRGGDAAALLELQRAAHTMKGSGRMAGAMRFGALMHQLETLTERAAHAFGENLEAYIDVISSGYTTAENMISLLAPGAVALPVAAATAGKPAAEQAEQERMLRIPMGTIESLDGLASDMSATTAILENRTQSTASNAQDVGLNVLRLKALLNELTNKTEAQIQARNNETERAWDSLELDRFTRLQELTRMIVECAADITDAATQVETNSYDMIVALQDQTRIGGDIHHLIHTTRLASTDALHGRMIKIARLASADTGKKVSVEMHGQIRIDSNVLAAIIAPMEHILRNSVAHGIEGAVDRARHSKPEIGTIVISSHLDGSDAVVSVRDDGAGIRLDAVRAKAIERGLIQPAQTLSDQETIDLLFLPGFSTADEVSQIAGRGVGLDVVRAAMHALGGEVSVHSELGRGATFTLRFPVLGSYLQAIPVRVEDNRYAVPTMLIHEVTGIDPEAAGKALASGEIERDGHRYMVTTLSTLTGHSVEFHPRRNNPLLLLRPFGDLRVALLTENPEPFASLVVRPVTGGLSLPGIMGASVMGDGSTTLVINPAAMAHHASRTMLRSQLTTTSVKAPEMPTVMVVDDSLTVRKLTDNLLRKNNYHVTLAKDGLDALEQLTEAVPDIFLVDIEMPRMNGFELTEAIRNHSNPEVRAVPIVIISSRSADKHTEHIMRLGANQFIAKPYKNEELLASIEQHLRERAAATA